MARSNLLHAHGPQPRAVTFCRRPATALGLGLLLITLVLTPLLFSSSTLGAFEFPKVMLLTLTAILTLAIGLCALFQPPSAEVRRKKSAVRGWGSAIVSGALGTSYAVLGILYSAVCRRPLSLGFVLFLVSAAVSTAASINPLTSLLGTHESHAGLWTVAVCTILFFAVRGLCRNFTDARLLLGGCVVAAAPAAAYALLQVASLDPITWAGLSGVGDFLRPFGPLGHPNFLAAYLVMTLPLTIHFAGRAAARRRWIACSVLALIALASGLAIALSVSRAAWLALGCVVLVLLVRAVGARRWRAAADLALLPVGGAVLACLLAWGGDHPLLTALRQRLSHLGDSVSRQHIWETGLAIYRDHPILGCGPDTFQLAFSPKRSLAYWQVEWNLTPARAHNEAIHVLATQGLVGAGALLVLLAGLVCAGVRAWRRAPAEARPLLLAIFAGTLGFLVQNAFGYTVAACGALFVTFAGLLARFGEEGADDVPELPLVRCRWSIVGLVCAGVLAVVVFTLEFIGPNRDALRAVIAGVVLLAALGATGWALLRVAAMGDTAILPAAVPTPEGLSAWSVGWRRAANWGVWIGAAALIFVAVLRPLHANVLCGTADRHFVVNPREAVAMFAEAAFEDPLRELSWSKLGAAAQVAGFKVANLDERRGLFRLARTALERACRLSPLNAYHHANLGHFLGRQAQLRCANVQDAYEAFERALTLDGRNVNFYADAANAALSVKDWGKARVYAERGVDLDPQFAPTRAQLGYLALMDKRYADAAKLLREANHAEWHGETSARVIALANLATAYTHLQWYEGAADVERQALELAPHFVEVRCNFAGALERLGRRTEAAAEYRRVLEDAPEHRGAKAGLARLGG